jgi:FkbM family methyltransferase
VAATPEPRYRRLVRDLARRGLEKAAWALTDKPRAHLQAWRHADGDGMLRLDYDLGRDSIVVDVGGYRGQWASDIVAMYGCRVHVFEPVAQLAAAIERRFQRQPLVTLHPVGLAAEDGVATMWLAGDASSHERNGGQDVAQAPLWGVERVFADLGAVDLMKVNIEGGEYDLLAKLIDTGLIGRVRDLQVQFHDFVPDAQRRMERLRERLAATHEPTFQYDFVWENWRRR